MGTIRFEKVKPVYALHTFLRHTLHILVILVLCYNRNSKSKTYGMDQRTAFTVKAYANSSPPFSTADRQHEFADCVHALEDCSAYCVSGIQTIKGL
jgi:hypothetical protein